MSDGIVETASETKAQYRGLRVVQATADPQMDEVYSLRYRAYLKESAIEPNCTRRFIDNYDLNRTSVPLGVVNQRGRLIGAIRFAVQPPMSHGIMDFRSSPEFQVFPDVLRQLEQDDRPIASGARFAIEPENPRRSEIAVLLMLAQVVAARASGAKWGLATVRGSHLHFYRRFCAMKPLCEPRRMPNLNYDYTLMGVDIDEAYADVIARYPQACRDYFEREHPFWSAEITHALPELAMRGAA
ncbi:MAG: hypothetical protein ACFB03_07345 [Paracoccaceae bacterium]